jgi:hypothetical protein
MRLLAFVVALGAAGLASSAANAQCTWTNLTNGTTANATQVMNNFACKAPLDSPHFSGAVGIGTDTPGARLHLFSATGLSARFESGVSGGDVNFLSFHYAGAEKAYVGFGSTNDNFYMMNVFNNSMYLGTNGAVRLSIASNGYVGIGTTLPQTKLHVSGSGVLATRLETDASGNQANFISFNYAGTEKGYVGFGSTSNALHLINLFNAPLYLGTNGSTKLAIAGSGEVGIGTASPGQKLDVAGTIRQSGCTTAGTLNVNGSGDIVCSSDARLKRILGAYTAGLDSIVRIQPQRFVYKSANNARPETFVHAGFIAQNVSAAIPEASARQKDGFYSLETTAILATAVNAIKELKAQNDRQAAEIDRLKSRLSGIERSARLRTANNVNQPGGLP